MGNLTRSDKIKIALVSILILPLYLIRQSLIFIGILKKPNYEYDPSKDPNYVEPSKPQE